MTSAASSVRGRFDDLTAGTALSFDRPSRVLVATEPAEVVPVLAEVDRATAGGCWAFGYVAYEAAAGLDPSLAGASRPRVNQVLAFYKQRGYITTDPLNHITVLNRDALVQRST